MVKFLSHVVKCLSNWNQVSVFISEFHRILLCECCVGFLYERQLITAEYIRSLQSSPAPASSHPSQWFSKCGPDVLAPLDLLLTMHILRPHPRPIESETLGTGFNNLCLASPLDDSLMVQSVKNATWNAEDPDLTPGSRRSPGEGNGNPLQ